MKIVQVVTQMEAGGAQKVASLLTTELRNRGHQAELWFLYTKRPAYSGLPGVRSLCDHPPLALDYVRIVICFGRLLWRERPDVLITHTHFANVLAHSLSWLCRIRHRIAVQHNPVGTYPTAARVADRIIGGMGAYSCNVAVSNTVADSISRYPNRYKKRLRVLYSGIPDTVQRDSREATRERWCIPDKAITLINIGRLSRQKNQEFLIRLLPEALDFHLLLVGEGELRGELKALADMLGVNDRVRFTGEVSPAEVASLLHASDVFVFPSHFEAVGLAMLEAMLAGVPVITNDIPSSREFLASCGALIDVNSPERWISQIYLFSGMSERAGTVIRCARERVRHFTVSAMTDRYESLMT